MLYLLVHTWRKEDFKTVGRKVIEAMPALPKGACMIASHISAGLTGAWCVYETENVQELKDFWAGHVPEMHMADVVPIIQFFPPGPESYKVMHILSTM